MVGVVCLTLCCVCLLRLLCVVCAALPSSLMSTGRVPRCCQSECQRAFVDTNLATQLKHTLAKLRACKNYGDRRVVIANSLCRTRRGVLLHGQAVCIQFLVFVFAVSRATLYNCFGRVENNLPVSGVLRRPPETCNAEYVCGWMRALAKLHDPQPDKNFTILAYRRKRAVYDAYCDAVKAREVPAVSWCYFLSVWKNRLGSSIVVRKCMRFALCDTCTQIQREREATTDRATLQALLRRERKHIKVRACVVDAQHAVLLVLHRGLLTGVVQLIKEERLAYARRMREARDAGDEYLSIALDGADQGIYGLPYYSQV